GIRDLLLARGVARQQDFFEPAFATKDELALVHSARYLERLESITAQPELGYYQFEAPCTRAVLAAFYAMAGSSNACASLALEHQFSAKLGGGFHHAFADHG